MQFAQGVIALLIQGFTLQSIEISNLPQGLGMGITSLDKEVETIEAITISKNETEETIINSREFSNEVPSKLSPQTEPTAQSFKCDDIGRFAHPNDCEKYYFCFNRNETHIVFTCPNHLAFDSVTQRCVHNFAVCATVSKCTHDKRILPNANDKSTYFECKFRHLSQHFVLRKRNCAAGREFDAELGYCKSKYLNDDFPSDNSNSFEDSECEQVGIFTDYSNDFGYFECVVKSVSNGTLQLIRHSCPAFHVFVATKKQCVPYLEMK